jgi:hypothetical protein
MLSIRWNKISIFSLTFVYVFIVYHVAILIQRGKCLEYSGRNCDMTRHLKTIRMIIVHGSGFGLGTVTLKFFEISIGSILI